MAKIPLFIVVLVNGLLLITGQQWESPFLEDPQVDNVAFEPSSNGFKITLDENNDNDAIIAVMTYTGSSSPLLQPVDPPTNPVLTERTGIDITQNAETSRWEIFITKKQDYETNPQNKYEFILIVDSVQQFIQLHVRNIDDNAPEITPDENSNPCEIEEYSNEVKCSYTIVDLDGMLNDVNHLITSDNSDIFAFDRDPAGSIPEDQTEMRLKLTLKQQLDYVKLAMHVINLEVTDTVHTTSLRILVNVVDIPNLEPTWTNIFQSQQFDEKTEQNFQVEAKDGDIGIDDEIVYFLEFDDTADWSQKITIDPNTGYIHVDPFDRDALEMEIFKFSIKACEVHEPKYCTKPQSVTFIVDDINDNAPVFTVDGTNDKVVNLELPENRISTISSEIIVNDIDLGENARYDLKLLSDANYEEAFSVAPNSGYQRTSVQLFIIDATKLDYEEDNWREFSFTLEAIETVQSINTEPDIITFSITLINRNDELPEFQLCEEGTPDSTPDSCIIEIPETFPGNTKLVTLFAYDRDIDSTVEHSLLGEFIKGILEIDPETGVITTRDLARPFDYETLSEIIVQVQAIDSIPGDEDRNIALAQLTIKLTDVNDESPRITVQNAGDPLMENCGTCSVGMEIIATDEDSMAQLEMYVDWDQSEAIKNGRKVTDSEEFQPFKGCVEIDIKETSTSKRLVADLKFVEKVPGNTPDYEIFDSLDLRIVAVDTDQEDTDAIPNSVSVNVQVYIENDNDNEPIFTENTLDAKTVVEHSTIGSLIGYIVATDRDNDELKYSLTPREGTEEDGKILVTIDEKSGELKVAGDIDADIPIEKLFYDVKVTDGKHPVVGQIEIIVEDTNDLNPEFITDAATIEVREQSETGTNVVPSEADPDCPFLAIDGDRDKENHELEYSIDRTTNLEVRGFFDVTVIETSSGKYCGRVFVSNSEGQMLDRDNSEPPPPINIILKANDKGGRLATLNFEVKLTDINNKAPVLQTQTLTIKEDAIKNDIFTEVIQATDDDESGTPNSYINFEIVSIDIPEAENLFELTDPDSTSGTVKLQIRENLRGHHGSYKLTLKMCDEGTDPQQQCSEGILGIDVEKYNFEPPAFEHPLNSDRILLSDNQQIGQPIKLFGGATLDALKANDQQGGKFLIEFEVNDPNSILTKTDDDYLTVSTLEYAVNTRYEVEIKAKSMGEPLRETTIVVLVTFVDADITPSFAEIEGQTYETNDFVEESENQIVEFPAAKYTQEVEGAELEIYYYVQTALSEFTVPDPKKNELHLVSKLDREVQEEYTVLIQAANKEGGSVNVEPEALLTVNIKLKDINDNPPVFDKDVYYAIIPFDEKKDSIIETVKADDPDVDDKITYEISNVDDRNAQNFPNFEINAENGQIKLENDVSSAASGFVTLTVTASDNRENPATGENHVVEVPVEIYLVSQDVHIVQFKFQNTQSEVEAKRDKIIGILRETFKDGNDVPYDPTIKRIAPDSDEITRLDDEEETTERTVCDIYFLDTTLQRPVEKQTIEVHATDIKTYTTLENKFREEELYLLSFSTSTEPEDNIEEVLRAWLIGISVVLGSLCVLLIVVFVLKIRSLTKRLNKLSVTMYGSQESGLNRKVAPNTNKNALEGSNPVFSTEKQMPEFDRHSISSGDSDFIGVENNPDFQRQYEKNGIQRY